ncbi:MAG: hypothetical protein SFZ23_05560 [Planctomycetota bacterium]|nr:hypothetical protein [Planctomycetota bacterium]
MKVRGDTTSAWLGLGLLLGGLLAGGGCVSRADQLRARGREVEAALIAERDRVLQAPTIQAAERDARLDQLTRYRGTLSAANVAVGAIANIPTSTLREPAYDAVEELYSTIMWNIPLGPGEKIRDLPLGFRSGQFNVNELTGSTGPSRPTGSKEPDADGARPAPPGFTGR